MATTFFDIQTLFHTMPQTKFEIDERLEMQWLLVAVADYELNIGCELGYDKLTLSFSNELSSSVCRTLAQMMYTQYLQRELSRVMALNGVYGKDITVTGQDATKRVTKQELDSQLAFVETLLHRQKNHSYN